MDVVPGRDGWVRLPMTAPYFRIFSPLGMARASQAQAQRRADRGVALLQHHLGARRQRAAHDQTVVFGEISSRRGSIMACLSVVLCDFVSCMKSIFKLEVNQGNHHFRH